MPVPGSAGRKVSVAGSPEKNAKVKAALRYELVPILCIGEPLEVRRGGDHIAYTLSQLDAALRGVKAEQVAGMAVAYEPIWAIGTGEVASAAVIQVPVTLERNGIRGGLSSTSRRTPRSGSRTSVTFSLSLTTMSSDAPLA